MNRINNNKLRIVACAASIFLVSSGCAVTEGFMGSGEPLLEPIYDGNWTARVESYRIKQVGPAGPGFSSTNWTCGDGEPFEFDISVEEGVVTVPNFEPIVAGRISVNSTFKTSYRRSEDRTSVLSGNFENLTGKLENRKNGLAGCRFKFKMTRSE